LPEAILFESRRHSAIAAIGQAILSLLSIPSKGDPGKTDADKQRDTPMTYVLSNISCKEHDRRGIIRVTLQQAIVAPSKIGYGGGL
jgi:hypothetical protein